MPQPTPEEIDRALKRIGNAWKRCPQFRLAQLIDNAIGAGVDLFYVEDKVLVESVERYAANVMPPVSPRTKHITDGDWP